MNDTIAKPADYGIDAPRIVRNLGLVGIGGPTLGIVTSRPLARAHRVLAVIVLVYGLMAGASCLLTAMLMVWTSKVGKLRARDRLLDAIPWSGDEMVLDVGPGRGLLLIGAAKRLRTGKAIGVEIWRDEDQSGNRPEATWINARAEGVAERIELKDGDVRHLPLGDETCDVVVSSLTLHNIGSKAERAQAVREIARVLKPGGRLALLDFHHTDEYARVLYDAGCRDVQRSGRQFLPVPVRTVTAIKRKDGP